MKKIIFLALALAACSMLLSAFAAAADISSSGVKGRWTGDTTWVGGVVPGPNDNVTIVDGDEVTFNAKDAVVNNLTVGQGTSGSFLFSKVDTTTLTVNGNLEVKAGAIFKVQSRSVTGSLLHTVNLYGNLTNAGSNFDMRTGSSGSTLGVVNFEAIGSGNSIITMGPYTSSNNEFNGFTINKSGPGRVILGSDMVMAGGSSSEPPGNPYLVLERGIVETGPYALVQLYTNQAIVVGGSDTSYVLGAMGRGMSNSGSADRWFQIGDAKGYRPARVRCTTSGSATGHYARVEAIQGQANTGSSTFDATIDKVSEVRYFKVSYHKGASGAASMTFDKFSVSYGLDDGVAAGNTNLRVAAADSNRASWKDLGPTTTPYTTALDSLPRLIESDANSTKTLESGQFIYMALARVSGTTENSLTDGSVAVEQLNELPVAFAVKQNYPNPFNPSTTIEYSLPAEQMVSVRVFNTLGQEVASLVNEPQAAGSYRVTFDARSLSSGMYVYQVRAGALTQTRQMLLLK
jgi:hypothetical protein